MVKVLQHVGSSGSGGRGGWWVTPLLLQSPCQNILDHSVGVCVNVRQGVCIERFLLCMFGRMRIVVKCALSSQGKHVL